MNYAEKKRLIEQALVGLNATHREVLELAFFEGLSMAEIARRTGASVMNVRHYYYRSIDRLRSQLAVGDRSEAKFARKQVSRAQAWGGRIALRAGSDRRAICGNARAVG